MTEFSLKKIVLLCGLIALAMPLTACGHDDKDDEAKIEKADEDAKKITPICPQVAIVRELQSIEDYGREAAAPEQLVASAHLRKIDGDCAYVKGGIDVKFELGALAERGPRLGGKHTEFPYFIAVVNPEQTILNKDTANVSFTFSGDKHTPRAKDKRKDGPDYQVLIGFQLTQEQLDASHNPKTQP
jgi:hypothetical protein